MAIRGLIVFIVATGIGLTFSWFAGQGAATYADLPVFLLSAALAYVVNWVVFIPSAIARSEKYFDITGTLTYFTLIISALMLSPAPDTRALAVAAMVLLWATRLGLFLFFGCLDHLHAAIRHRGFQGHLRRGSHPLHEPEQPNGNQQGKRWQGKKSHQ